MKYLGLVILTNVLDIRPYNIATLVFTSIFISLSSFFVLEILKIQIRTGTHCRKLNQIIIFFPTFKFWRNIYCKFTKHLSSSEHRLKTTGLKWPYFYFFFWASSPFVPSKFERSRFLYRSLEDGTVLISRYLRNTLICM